jgi:N-acetylmuramoyl-L-alanine amidase
MNSIKYFSRTLLYIVFTCLVSFAASANVINGVRVWPAPDETRIVMDMADESHYSYFTLSNPQRLVVDIQQTSTKVRLPIKVADSPVLKQIRSSSPKDKNSVRLVLDLTQSVDSEVFKLAPTPNGEYGHRLVVDLAHPGSAASQAATKPVPAKTQGVTVTRDASQYIGHDDVVIAIDAGHGGEDPGSIGPKGRYEKQATLQISKKLADQLNAQSGVKAVLTRKGDYYLRLDKRSEIARKEKAHLLVSIHADAFHTPEPRGASVFVLNTRRANTEISKWVEDHERQSELLGGAGQVLAKNSNDRNVSQTLLDLQFSHSQKEGYKLAKDLLAEMGKVARLHKSEPVNASLAVLKSPDIPSVLIETGFISNPTEERLLFQSQHQNDLARAMSKAIMRYFEDNPPEGTLLAARKQNTKHVVKAGESLSVIAAKYGTSVDNLLEINRLKSTSLAVGQVLMISTGHSAALPSVSTLPRSESRVVTHVVKSGEFLGKIAQQYGVSVSQLKQQNNLKSNVVKVGQKLSVTTTVVVAASAPVPVRKYTVRRGDFLGKIASQFDVSVDTLREENHLKSDRLSVDQVLIIPGK